jgi:hypothetical protein
MDDKQRSSYVKELAKAERKYQNLYTTAQRLKNPKLVETLFAMESETRILIRDLEAGRVVSESEVKAKIKGIQAYESKIQDQLSAEKELDALADEVEKAWYVYSSTKGDIPSSMDPELVMEFHRLGGELQVMSRNIQDRVVRDPKKVRTQVKEFMDVIKRVEKELP